MRRRKEIKSQFSVNQSKTATTLMEKLRRLDENKDGIEEIAPMIYTEKKMGVMPGYDIRTDRFEVARIARAKINKAENYDLAKSEETGVTPKEEPGEGDKK